MKGNTEHCYECNHHFKLNLSEVYILDLVHYAVELSTSAEEAQFEKHWVRWSLPNHHLAIVPLVINNFWKRNRIVWPAFCILNERNERYWLVNRENFVVKGVLVSHTFGEIARFFVFPCFLLLFFLFLFLLFCYSSTCNVSGETHQSHNLQWQVEWKTRVFDQGYKT